MTGAQLELRPVSIEGSRTNALSERLQLRLYGITLEPNEEASLTNSRSIQNSEA